MFVFLGYLALVGAVWFFAARDDLKEVAHMLLISWAVANLASLTDHFPQIMLVAHLLLMAWAAYFGVVMRSFCALLVAVLYLPMIVNHLADGSESYRYFLTQNVFFALQCLVSIIAGIVIGKPVPFKSISGTSSRYLSVWKYLTKP